jgi:ParB/RepB/Spo0J family partition protein
VATTKPAPPQTTAGGDDFAGVTTDRRFGHLPLGQVHADTAAQPREAFDAERIEWLADSLRRNGQKVPAKVRWDRERAKWVLVFGEMRLRAARQAGLDTLLCEFVDRDLTPEEILLEQLLENIHRTDLQPVERAKGFRRLIEEHGWTAGRVASTFECSKATVSQTLSLLSLPADLLAAVAGGVIPWSAGYHLARVAPERQQELAERVKAGAITRDQLARETSRSTGGRTPGEGERLTLRGGHFDFVVTGNRVVVTGSKIDTVQRLIDALTELLQAATEHARSQTTEPHAAAPAKARGKSKKVKAARRSSVRTATARAEDTASGGERP